MATWKVIDQDTPFAHTVPHTLVVEAADCVDAFATAYDFLTRPGVAVYTGAADFDESERAKLVERGMPTAYGRAQLRGIERHAVRVAGRVAEA